MSLYAAAAGGHIDLKDTYVDEILKVSLTLVKEDPKVSNRKKRAKLRRRKVKTRRKLD
ncbi:hypothetical protein [[Limnothrix rosea] IAM M-220]|uniref:hypothetical protein n=1 Tax=[Limnothrix rosea] IAM M-220 TaxID=454133 RepID=UPI0015C52B8B|nr:hypothetical protein [[Limnothrix rosea] IAM M-220]